MAPVTDQTALRYPDDWKVADALPVYFNRYHFKNGGYTDRFFKIKLGRFFIPLPNISSRVEAVRIHDIHHLITGYSADYRGEAEIGAWEIAAGCGRYWVAWLLNLGSLLIGLFFYPRPLWNAFARGRRAKKSLYDGVAYDEILNRTLGDLRNEIGTEGEVRPEFQDTLCLTGWILAALLFYGTLYGILIYFLIGGIKILF